VNIIDEATALADHLELSGAVSLLKNAQVREAKLIYALLNCRTRLSERRRYIAHGAVSEPMLKLWDDEDDELNCVLAAYADQ
jgi:hypothetical protein